MITVPAVLARNRRLHGSRLAVVDERRLLTHADLAERAWALGRVLLAGGLGRGEPVGVLTGNGCFAAEAFCAVTAAGGMPAMLNGRLAPRELAATVVESGARTVLVERAMIDVADAAWAVLDADVERIFEGAIDEPPDGLPFDLGVGLADPAVMLFTGGTTGTSKGVVLSHANVMANALNEIVDTDMEGDDVTLCITPMHHSASLLCWFLPHLLLGATTVLQRRADEAETVELMARHGVTNCFLVPTMVRRLLASGLLHRQAVPSLRRLYVGGASFTRTDKDPLRAALPGVALYYQYGLTEAGPIVTRLRPEDMFDDELDGSIGHEFLLTEVSVRDPDGVTVADGEVGEMWVRGPNVMVGYHRRPEATAEVLVDGWLRTGDAGARGPRRELWFRDRYKDLIKTGGENVFSAEVEQVLLTHPAVSEAAVMGWASEAWDEEVRAIVALRPGSPAVDETTLRGYCRERLAGYKVPKRVAIVPVEAIPVSPSGKVLKRRLREDFEWGT